MRYYIIRISRSATERGFTLLELMIALSVACVLSSIAVPSFETLTAQSRLATTSNQLLHTLAGARQLAITRGMPITVCAGTPNAGCTGSSAAGQWIVFVDADHDGNLDVGEPIQHFEQTTTSSAVQFSANGPFRGAIVFTPRGTAQRPGGAFAAGRLRLCAAHAFSPNTTDIVLIGSGRVVTESHDFRDTCESL